jgi:gentisate 1,2-dioxygenase
VDWDSGSLLSIPLNTGYRHVNDNDSPVRLLAVTTFPFVLNSFDNEAFIHGTAFAFEDRYDGSSNFFEHERYTEPEWLESNFVANIRDSSLTETTIRGKGNRVMHWIMAGNQMLSLHVSEVPPGKYKKAHRHSNGSAFLLLTGVGYTLAWPARAEHRRQRTDWAAGTFFAPPPYWYHQHFNPGSEPARYLSINTPDLLKHLGLRFTDQVETRQPGLKEAFERERGEITSGQGQH